MFVVLALSLVRISYSLVRRRDSSPFAIWAKMACTKHGTLGELWNTHLKSTITICFSNQLWESSSRFESKTCRCMMRNGQSKLKCNSGNDKRFEMHESNAKEIRPNGFPNQISVVVSFPSNYHLIMPSYYYFFITGPSMARNTGAV